MCIPIGFFFIVFHIFQVVSSQSQNLRVAKDDVSIDLSNCKCLKRVTDLFSSVKLHGMYMYQ